MTSRTTQSAVLLQERDKDILSEMMAKRHNLRSEAREALLE